ncbi:MAG: AtpZ/AtpI family protein [Pseudomonadota bacterium]
MGETEDLKARIEAAKKAGQPKQNDHSVNKQASGVAAALTHSFGMAVALGIGALIGYTIDRLAGTGPWALLIFLVFGMAAGFLNMIRAAQQMARDAVKQQAASSPPQDETERDGENG